MALGAAPISPLVVFCVAIPSARVVTILSHNTFLYQRQDNWLEQISERLKTYFAERLSLMEQIILGILYGYL
jgi:hypothetical protein